jgi:RNA polymerase-binding transcription factor DksA
LLLSIECVKTTTTYFDSIRDALAFRRGAITRWARALNDDERHEVEDIDAALRRLDEGSYGRCEHCGLPIGWQRMRAVPEGRHCATCETALVGRRQ